MEKRSFIKPEHKTLQIWFIAIFAIGVICRIGVFSDLALGDQIFVDRLTEQNLHTELYRTALTQHFFEYLAYNHVVPVLVIVWDGLSEIVFGPQNTAIAKLLTISILDSLTASISLLIARRLGIKLWLSVPIALIICCRLIVWNTANLGGGWYALAPITIATFSWLLLVFLQRPRFLLAASAGISGAFVTLAYTFGVPLVFPAMFLTVVLLLARSESIKKTLFISLLLVFPPALSTGTIIIKNGMIHGLWSVSSGLGQNVMQAYNSGLKDPTGRDRGAYMLGKRMGYPEWWLWCYDEAERKKVHPQANIAGWYGMCLFENTKNRITTDFTALVQYLKNNPNPQMEHVVIEDLKTHKERPWLWSGYVTVRSSRTSLEYGKISSRIIGDTLITKPDYFIRRAYRTFFTHWLGHGAQCYVTENRSVHDEPLPVWLINLFSIPLFYLGALLSLYYFFRSAFRFVLKLKRPLVSEVLHGVSSENLVVATMVIFPLLTSILIACCENYRHSMVMIPLLLMLSGHALGRRSFWNAWRLIFLRLANRLQRIR